MHEYRVMISLETDNGIESGPHEVYTTNDRSEAYQVLMAVTTLMGCGSPEETDMKTDLQLTKRELFAALICAGYSANPKVNASFEAVARDCVRQTDALIKALNYDTLND